MDPSVCFGFTLTAVPDLRSAEQFCAEKFQSYLASFSSYAEVKWFSQQLAAIKEPIEVTRWWVSPIADDLVPYEGSNGLRYRGS